MALSATKGVLDIRYQKMEDKAKVNTINVITVFFGSVAGLDSLSSLIFPFPVKR
ncbi:MAG: hypothetical protein Q7I96_07260 [Methanobacteriaceae archaeon]|nr:hypothetical protein [Methanobacteriaceae archaeon]